MGLKDAILQKVLRKVDDTFGKKFKVIDEVTDLFQGTEGRINDLEDSNIEMKKDIKKIKKRILVLESQTHEPRDFIICEVCKNKIKESK